MKKCIKCNTEKELEMFSKDCTRKDGLRPECKNCKSLRDKEYRNKNKEKKQLKDKEYYNSNIEKIKKKSKEWYLNNFDHVKEVKSNYYQNNREKVDLDKKIWYEKNKDKMKEWMNNYIKNRYKNDINYRIKSIMNKRIRDYVRNKTSKTMYFVGCTTDFLKDWIEYQFDENMNWNNLGTFWSFDHVKPCNSYNLSIEEEILECYNWKNLRPLNSSENSSKKDKIDTELIKNHKILADTYLEKYNSILRTKLDEKSSNGLE